MTTLLLDCRAYELVSAADAGGYDVQSDLIPGQVTLPAYPARDATGCSTRCTTARSRASPGPTNLGLDPYVATRGAGGWTTSYVGIPAEGTPATRALRLAARRRPTTACRPSPSAATSICDPCFADGKTGIPVHLPDGSLVQGMAGSLDPGPVGDHRRATSAAQLSADGTHLVFGSTSKFEPDGNSNGDVTIYDRDLVHRRRPTSSRRPTGGATMTGAGNRRARHLRRRLAGPGRPAAAPDDAAGQPLLAPLHEHRRLRPRRST